MTNELEKQFFDTFGIDPKEEKYCYWECKKPELENVACNNTECEHYRHKIHYPQISDRILLELIIILGTICTVFDKNVDDLKENVLKNLIELSGRYHIYNQVRTLFKEG